MAQNLVELLNAARAEVVKLEAQVKQSLKNLPQEYGYSDVNTFIAAMRDAAGLWPRYTAGIGNPTKKRRRRMRITPEMKAHLEELIGDGKTGNQVASELGISLPSVNNIKRELGLVKARK